MPLSLTFDDKEPIDLVAYGDGEFVSISIPVELLNTFISGLNENKRVRIIFKKGNDTAWNIGLDGASDALKPFFMCYKARRSSL